FRDGSVLSCSANNSDPLWLNGHHWSDERRGRGPHSLRSRDLSRSAANDFRRSSGIRTIHLSLVDHCIGIMDDSILRCVSND
ncbi:hypothetical protein PENTCL1PPCAC_4983, partial [Pristionchus entomophagus]